MPAYLVPCRPVTAFADLGLSESTLLALQDVGYEKPSPIQEQAIPPMLDGRDLICDRLADEVDWKSID